MEEDVKEKEKETEPSAVATEAAQSTPEEKSTNSQPATYSVAPSSFKATEEVINSIREYLAMYKGTHNFFNFTSRVEQHAASNKRYILSFTVCTLA